MSLRDIHKARFRIFFLTPVEYTRAPNKQDKQLRESERTRKKEAGKVVRVGRERMEIKRKSRNVERKGTQSEGRQNCVTPRIKFGERKRAENIALGPERFPIHRNEKVLPESFRRIERIYEHRSFSLSRSKLVQLFPLEFLFKSLFFHVYSALILVLPHFTLALLHNQVWLPILALLLARPWLLDSLNLLSLKFTLGSNIAHCPSKFAAYPHNPFCGRRDNPLKNIAPQKPFSCSSSDM